jgi:hypothetical protein
MKAAEIFAMPVRHGTVLHALLFAVRGDAVEFIATDGYHRRLRIDGDCVAQSWQSGSGDWLPWQGVDANQFDLGNLYIKAI